MYKSAASSVDIGMTCDGMRALSAALPDCVALRTLILDSLLLLLHSTWMLVDLKIELLSSSTMTLLDDQVIFESRLQTFLMQQLCIVVTSSSSSFMSSKRSPQWFERWQFDLVSSPDNFIADEGMRSFCAALPKCTALTRIELQCMF